MAFVMRGKKGSVPWAQYTAHDASGVLVKNAADWLIDRQPAVILAREGLDRIVAEAERRAREAADAEAARTAARRDLDELELQQVIGQASEAEVVAARGRLTAAEDRAKTAARASTIAQREVARQLAALQAAEEEAAHVVAKALTVALQERARMLRAALRAARGANDAYRQAYKHVLVQFGHDAAVRKRAGLAERLGILDISWPEFLHDPYNEHGGRFGWWLTQCRTLTEDD